MFDPSIHLPLPAGFFVRSINRQECLSPGGATQIRYTVTFEELAVKKEESPESIVIESSVPALQAHPIKAEWAHATADIAANLRSLKDAIQKNMGLEEPCRTFAVGPVVYANLLKEGWIEKDGSLTAKFNEQFGTFIEKVLNVEVLTEGNEDDTADLAKCEGC